MFRQQELVHKWIPITAGSAPLTVVRRNFGPAGDFPRMQAYDEKFDAKEALEPQSLLSDPSPLGGEHQFDDASCYAPASLSAKARITPLPRLQILLISIYRCSQVW